MGKKQFKKLNELRVKAVAGDVMAQKALEAAMFVPHHLRRPDRLGSIHRRMGTRLVQSTHITAKAHKAVPCYASVSIKIEDRVARLQMLKDRRERREAL